MLKLKRVQILGFKSFADRTEVLLSGEGVAAVVGPNGCGKSNISDAISWVLGEQSAKSLRGIKMEDVIFAGTRDRKPTGMAEVSLTLVDPEVYDGGDGQADGPELVVSGKGGRERSEGEDWDEAMLRQKTALETELAVAEAQPGTVVGGDMPGPGEVVGAVIDGADGAGLGAGAEPESGEGAAAEGPGSEGAGAAGTNVVLKIRRRKFGRAPVRAGEITVTRRLFRSGDSEYLLNGKICRLRDIQDIFLGTGLGGESYAIIGQERIGQLLSSKPLDRRSILEEAAGITRFKTKKRLAELRLESARQNLSRVNDIFDEVTRQMGILKRQANKAERYGELRDEMRGRLRVVLSSRMRIFDAEHAELTERIAALAGEIERRAAELEAMDAEHTAGMAAGYALDGQIRAANVRASESAVELERILARLGSNADRVAELETRIVAGADDLRHAVEQIAQMEVEATGHRTFLEGANAAAAAARAAAAGEQGKAQEAGRALAAAEARVEQMRREGAGVLQRANGLRNEVAQAEAALAGLDRESERLIAESKTAHEELAALGHERGQAKLSFESVTEHLARIEAEIAELRIETEARRSEESASKRRGDSLRGEVATLRGRRGSLEALIHDHSYSTDTVRSLLKGGGKGAREAAAGELVPMGTMADFLEVDGRFENVVDEFLRDELNYVVVRSWAAADAGIRLLQKDVSGRATFLVHGDSGEEIAEEARDDAGRESIEGAVPLLECVRVLDGFGPTIGTLAPKLRDGFIATDAATAQRLALEHPRMYFLAPTGEIYRNLTVTAGRTRAQGPLALKRELDEVQKRLAGAEAELAETDLRTASLGRAIVELQARLEARGQERRGLERESANSGAALRQMESETARIERRLQDWQLTTERNRDQRNGKADLIERRRGEAAELDQQHAKLEQQMLALVGELVDLRAERERRQQAAAEAAAALAGLEERRRNAQANADQTTRLLGAQRGRAVQMEAQMAAARAEKLRREEETVVLGEQNGVAAEARAIATAESERLTAEAADLRAKLGVLDGRLRQLRQETEGMREGRAGLLARVAKLGSDIEHLDQTSRNDLGVEPAELRADGGIAAIEGEALQREEEQTRVLKGRLEAMGPVNMMALEEYTETTTRHGFLETQRRDLLESIENTQSSIREIDDVSRVKFDEAFRVINANFSETFAKLFGGGQASMRLTDQENAAESGIDILASPPGKKLQNILLLSGGEKALTALSLLVAIFQFQPAPFCVLDEVDAPLDETNVGRFARLIHEMSATTQFLVITHSKRTMAEADVIYGVTMQEPGVSKIVSVNLARERDAGQGRRRAVA